jgi:hypothetical protein
VGLAEALKGERRVFLAHGIGAIAGAEEDLRE